MEKKKKFFAVKSLLEKNKCSFCKKDVSGMESYTLYFEYPGSRGARISKTICEECFKKNADEIKDVEIIDFENTPLDIKSYLRVQKGEITFCEECFKKNADEIAKNYV